MKDDWGLRCFGMGGGGGILEMEMWNGFRHTILKCMLNKRRGGGGQTTKKTQYLN